MNKIIYTLIPIISCLLVACAPSSSAPAQPVLPTPTTVSLFGTGNDASLDTSGPTSAQNALSTVRTRPIASASSAGLSDESARPRDSYRELIIFDEKLDSNWSLDNSENIGFDLLDTTHWFEPLVAELDLVTGAVSAAVTPQEGSGRFYFTVNEATSEFYPRSRVLGVSFWLNSGKDYIDTDDLAVNVVGSNNRRFWTPDFDVEFQDSEAFFFETRLYLLDVNRSIPPKTWTQVIVWMDELIFAPDYDFVTGVYIKNDVSFSNTYYVDRVALLMENQ